MGSVTKKQATLKDIAESVNCSVMTVSRTLNGKSEGHVSESLRNAICRNAERLGYRPSAAAKALRCGSTKTIGMVVGGISGYSQSCFAHAFLRELQKHGYRLHIAITDYNQKEEQRALQEILDTSPDGIRYGLYLPHSGRLYKHLKKKRYPILLNQMDAANDFSVLRYENKRSFEKVMQFFSGRGHRRMALILSRDAQLFPEISEWEKEYSLKVDCFFLKGGDFFSLRKTCSEIAAAKSTCVFGLPSRTISYFLSYIEEEGIRNCPECIGIYGIPRDYFKHPRLFGMVHRPFRPYVEMTAEILLRMIENPGEKRGLFQLPSEFLSPGEVECLYRKQLRDSFFEYFG